MLLKALSLGLLGDKIRNEEVIRPRAVLDQFYIKQDFLAENFSLLTLSMLEYSSRYSHFIIFNLFLN